MQPDGHQKPRGSRNGRGRPRTHGLTALRKAVATLGTRRLDNRSAIAIAAKQFKADLIQDLGGDVSRQQETIIELAARTWIIVQALDDWLLRQPTLVAARKRAVLPVVLQRQQLADSLSRMLERLGLERRTSRGGRDSVDHSPGGHDDVANAAAGAIWRWCPFGKDA